MLAEMIRVKNNLVTILDGGWGTYTVPNLPFKVEWPVFAVFHTTGLRAPSVIGCVIRIKDPSGHIVLQHDFQFEKLDDGVVRALYSQVLSFDANVLGAWNLEVVSGEYVLATMPVHVLLAESMD
ncbi:hypothetical protein [Rugamonas apoptosis]|uniref:DUF3859 domain-containing protein n=1 Tax=Rugamonas apoptosis TaxID=2758570 RepID=A0A7W2IM73_9BURK|nr:hypothetical protein [Rugamonas apoptosis]MBA5689388.1 hypothetical protein [Rugamonas apoptosis]